MAAVLIVGDWASRCGACGDAADVGEPAHLTTPPGGLGCGALWTGVALEPGAAGATATAVVRIAAELAVPTTANTEELKHEH